LPFVFFRKEVFMGKRHLVGAVVAGHVGVICIVALIGGCAKERKKVALTTSMPYEEMKAPESKPESILEPEGLVEETELLVAREPESIPVKEERPEKAVEKSVEEMKVVKLQPRKEVKPIIPEMAPVKEGVPSPSAKRIHKVVAGDSLWKISRAYGLTVRELAEANELNPDAVLRIGQVLVIPVRIAKAEESVAVKEAPPLPEVEEAPPLPGVKEASPLSGIEGTPPVPEVEEASAMPEAEGPPRILETGEEVRTPGPQEKLPLQRVRRASPAKERAVPAATMEQRKHVVRKGESLWTISKRYGVNVREIVDLNRIDEPSRIKVGQVLLIPPRKESATGRGE
jgi:LysM repeat protein